MDFYALYLNNFSTVRRREQLLIIAIEGSTRRYLGCERLHNINLRENTQSRIKKYTGGLFSWWGGVKTVGLILGCF